MLRSVDQDIWLFLLYLKLFHKNNISACAFMWQELANFVNNDKILCIDEDFNIVQWWHDHKFTYPELSILTWDVLSVS